jgi:general transcription factor 3C polypeptide 2
MFRGIVISLEDGTLKFLSLSRIANDVPVTGRPFAGTKTQGVSTYQLSKHLIWNVHVSETTGTFSRTMPNHSQYPP